MPQLTEAQMKAQFNIKEYIMGRTRLPPWILAYRKSKPFAFTGSTGALASGASTPVTIQIHDDAYFLVETIQILSDAFDVNQDKGTVQITDNTVSQSWSNIALPIRDVAGLGWNPKYLSDPNILRPTGSVTLQFVNNNASTRNYYVVLSGRKIYGLSNDDAALLARRMWYQYGLNITSLASSAANQKFNLNIYNESDFLLKRMLSQQGVDAVFGNSGGALDQEVLIQLRDTTNDTYLFSDFVPLRAVFGYIQGIPSSLSNSWGIGSPFNLTKPWLMRRNGVIQATLTNDSTTNISAGFILTFEGIRIFDAK